MIMIYVIRNRIYNIKSVGRDSSAGIATRYGLDGRGSNPGGGEIFRTRPDRPCDPPSLLYKEYRFFPGSKAAGAWC
jgi:hypothetical protein